MFPSGYVRHSTLAPFKTQAIGGKITHDIFWLLWCKTYLAYFSKKNNFRSFIKLLVLWIVCPSQLNCPSTNSSTHHSSIQHLLNYCATYLSKPELRFCTGSNPACRVLEICNGKDLWQWSWQEIRLNAFCWSTTKTIHLFLYP